MGKNYSQDLLDKLVEREETMMLQGGRSAR